MRLPLGIQSYPANHPITGERLINCFAEQAPTTATAPVFIKRTPGLSTFATIDADPVLGLPREAWGGFVFSVLNGVLWRTDESGVSTQVGPLGGPGPYTFAAIRSSITVCDGAEAWNYNGTDFQQILPAAPGFAGFKAVTKSRQRVLFANTVDDQFAWSEPTAARNIVGTSKRSAEGVDDTIVTLFTQLDEVFVFGSRSLELFYDTGGASDTYQRRGPSHIARGLAAPLAIASEDNSVFWLGDDRIVYRLDGLTPVRQSNHGIETALQNAVVADAEASFHTWDGHKFFVLTLPTDAQTFVYDLNTGLWHERQSWNLGRWRAVGAVQHAGETLVGDAFNSRLLKLDGNAYDEAGEILGWTIQTAPIRDNQNRRTLFLDRLEAEFDPGQGATRGNAATPEIVLDWSDDGGKSWSTPLIAKVGAGRRGDYGHRLVWHNLGQFVSRILRFRGTDPYPMRFYNLFAEITPGQI